MLNSLKFGYFRLKSVKFAGNRLESVGQYIEYGIFLKKWNLEMAICNYSSNYLKKKRFQWKDFSQSQMVVKKALFFQNKNPGINIVSLKL